MNGSLLYRLGSLIVIGIAAYNLGHANGKKSVPKCPEEKPPITAEEKEHAYETVFSFYTIGCTEALEMIKLKLHEEGDVDSYCRAAMLNYRKRWDEANP